MTENGFDVLVAKAGREGAAILLDGAMGTELDNLGILEDSPIWSAQALRNNPEQIARLHAKYAAAGAQIVTTCTFRTTKTAFRRAGESQFDWREAIRIAVSLARESAPDCLIAGSVAPAHSCFETSMAPDMRTAQRIHQSTVDAIESAGVDVLLLETFATRGETLGVCLAASVTRERTGTPFVISLTTNETGDLLSGEPIKDLVSQLEQLGPSAICLNCIPPRWVDAALRRLSNVTSLPIGVYANLGRPEPSQQWSGDAHLSPKAYAALALNWVAKGVSIIGACCGSTPAHIRHIASSLTR